MTSNDSSFYADLLQSLKVDVMVVNANREVSPSRMMCQERCFVLFLRDTGNRNVKEVGTSYAPWASRYNP